MVVPEFYLLDLERFFSVFDCPVIGSHFRVGISEVEIGCSKIGMVVPELYLLNLERFFVVFDCPFVISLV